MVGRTQTDIKSALSFASMTQVGIIFAEIGCGFRYLALAHLLGHACLRTLQLLRAPSLLLDYHRIENAIGHRRAELASVTTTPNVRRLYRFAFERGYLDNLLDKYLVGVFWSVFRTCDRWERNWTNLLSGTPSRESDELNSNADTGEQA